MLGNSTRRPAAKRTQFGDVAEGDWKGCHCLFGMPPILFEKIFGVSTTLMLSRIKEIGIRIFVLFLCLPSINLRAQSFDDFEQSAIEPMPQSSSPRSSSTQGQRIEEFTEDSEYRLIPHVFIKGIDASFDSINASVYGSLIPLLDFKIAWQDGPYTILIPSDRAWGAFPASILDSLLEPEGIIRFRKIIRDNILFGAYSIDDLEDVSTVTTLNGTDLPWPESCRIGSNDIVYEAKIDNSTFLVLDCIVME